LRVGGYDPREASSKRRSGAGKESATNWPLTKSE